METIDWKNIGFGYIPTDHNVRCTFANGAWGELRTHDDAYLNLTIPVEHQAHKVAIKDVQISEHSNWQLMHWRAIEAAYN